MLALRRGDYGETLPGERTLAEVFGVSRPTLRRAIAALVTQGWLKPDRGRPTRILQRPDSAYPAREVNRSIVFLSSHPLHSLSAGTMLAYELLSAELAANGYSLHFVACDAFRQRHGEESLPALMERHPAGAYILHQAPYPVQLWFARSGVPACIMGSAVEGLSLPAVDTDFAPAAKHAMGELRRLGHAPERVLLLLPQLDLAGNRAMREGFLNAGGSSLNVLAHPVDDAHWPAWISREILPLLGESGGPTAIIAGWARFTVALVSALGLRFAQRVPESVSVMCLADDPVFDMLIPRVTRYRRNSSKYVGQLRRIVVDLAHGRAPVRPQVLLIPELMPGGTTGAPRV